MRNRRLLTIDLKEVMGEVRRIGEEIHGADDRRGERAY